MTPNQPFVRPPVLIEVGGRLVNLSMVQFVNTTNPQIATVAFTDGKTEVFTAEEGRRLASAIISRGVALT